MVPIMKTTTQYKKNDLCKIILKDCKGLGGLQNQSNSCYFDSLLMSLFHFENNLLLETLSNDNIITKNPNMKSLAQRIISSLQKIHIEIAQGKVITCTNLRKMFQEYDNLHQNSHKGFQSINWTAHQQEPSDIIKFLHRLIHIPKSVKIINEKYGSNMKKKVLTMKDWKLISKDEELIDFANVYVDAAELFDNEKINLKKYIPKSKSEIVFDENNLWKPQNEYSFTRKLEKTIYKSADLLFIHIGRLFAGEKLMTYVDLPLSMKLVNNKHHIYIRSIIVHHGGANGGHYTTFIQCNGQWYHYDDLGFKKIDLIGDLDDLKSYKNGYVFKNCTDIVYA